MSFGGPGGISRINNGRGREIRGKAGYFTVVVNGDKHGRRRTLSLYREKGEVLVMRPGESVDLYEI